MKEKLMKPTLVLLLAATLWTSGISGSEETGKTAGPRLQLAMLTADKYSRNEKTVFAQDFPKIFAVYQVADVSTGTKLKAVWIAEKVEGFEANRKINESESTFSSKGEFMGAFSCPKPPQGWSAGTYLVELSIDGAVRKTLTFRVEKP